jgi:hypothetical protein
MGNVINLEDIKLMQKALDKANVQQGVDEPRMLAYRDLNGVPQIIVEGECISQQQYDNLPDDIRNMIITEEQNGRE